MKLKIAQVIGLNTDQKAAQVTSAIREDPSAPLGTGNSFLAAIELTSDDAFTKGRQILSELEDFFFEFEGTIPEKLNATLSEAKGKFPDTDADWSLCLASLSGKVLYLISQGQIEVYLKRLDKLSPLLSVGAPSQIISGFINPGDKILFATASIITFLGDDLEKSLDLSVESFKEEVEGRIGASELEDKGLAALVVEAEEENVEISPPAIPDSGQEPDQELPGQSVLSARTLFAKVLFQTISGRVKEIFGLARAYFPKSGRGRLILAVILIITVVSGAGYRYKLSRDQKLQSEFNQVLQQAQDNFNTAKGLANLNPADAKSKLDLAKDEVSKAVVLKPKDSRARDLKKQIEAESPSILQQSAVLDFPLFLDMDLVKKNFRAYQMSLSAGKLLLLDPGIKTLVVIDLAKKSNQILAGSDQLGDASYASLNGGSAFVFSKDKGIIKIDIANKKLVTVAKIDKSWGKVQDIYGFAGNVYLLDNGNPPAGGQIWKYLPAAAGYSDAREYLSKDTKADLGSAIRMQIESSVYILKSGGEVLRFTKGIKDNFSLGGLDKGVKDPKSFFTSSDTDNLYLLDSGNSRVLILTKTGSYKGQITGAKFATATDLAVDEVGKKVYLLEGSKIYSVELK